MQQVNLLPIQQNASMITEQLKVVQNANEYAITEPLSIREDNVLLNKEENCKKQTEEQTTIDSYVKNKSISTTIHKKSLGRPKKTEVILEIFLLLLFYCKVCLQLL